MRNVALWLLLCMPTATAGLVSCSSVGLAPAQTVDEKLAYAYGVHRGVLDGITHLAQARAVSPADGQGLLALADNARALLDSAQTIEIAGDINGAAQKLQLATAVLEQIETYLTQRGAK